jgi:hypothetical protein
MISTMSKPCRPYLFVALLVTVAIAPGCYTILLHPRLAQLDYRRPDHKHCSACHTSAEIWGFHHLPKAPATDVPWWYERFWSADDTTDIEAVPLPQRSMRPPEESSTPRSGAAKNPSDKQKPNAAATEQKKKEKGDGSAKDTPPKKSRRHPRPAGEKNE